MKHRARQWYAGLPDATKQDKTVKGWKALIAAFKSNFNPIGNTKEQQLKAWKDMKWDPATKESLDDWVYKYRQLGEELGYTTDQILDNFVCCIPQSLYIYTLNATDLDAVVKNVKKGIAMGVGMDSLAVKTEVKLPTAPAVPFMRMDDYYGYDGYDGCDEEDEYDYDPVETALAALEQARGRAGNFGNRGRGFNGRGGFRGRNFGNFGRGRSFGNGNGRGSFGVQRPRGGFQGYTGGPGGNFSNRGNGNGRGRSRFCEYCKATNHTILFCWKLEKDLRQAGYLIKRPGNGMRSNGVSNSVGNGRDQVEGGDHLNLMEQDDEPQMSHEEAISGLMEFGCEIEELNI